MKWTMSDTLLVFISAFMNIILISLITHAKLPVLFYPYILVWAAIWQVVFKKVSNHD